MKLVSPDRVARPVRWLAALILAAIPGLASAVPAQALTPPSNLRASYVSSRGIGLAWSNTGDGAYRVRFSKSKAMSDPDTWDVVGNYFEWTRLDANPTVAASRLSPATKYYFQVKAIKKATRDDLSSYGPVLAVTTAAASAYPELPPVELAASASGADSMHLSWRTRGPGVEYALRYTTNPSANVLKWTKVTVPAAGATPTGLKAGTTYYFRVRVVDRNGAAVSNYSARWSRATPSERSSPALTVVSYNVLKSGSGPSWASRRKLVAATIVNQAPDVIALQEATPVTVAGSSGKGVPQYADLLELLGSHYRYVTTEGSSGTRLAYDSRRLSLVTADAVKLFTYGPAARYAVWGILKDKASGKQFFVLNTHLEPGSNSSSVYNDARVRQADQVLGLIESQNPKGYPVILAGDMNSSRAARPENGPYRVFARAGLIDPLNNASSSWLAGQSAPAEHLIDAEYNSYNNFEQTARRTAYPVGTNADYILVSGRVRVAQWRTVVRVDSSRRFVGAIPSDHNLISATLHLP